MYETETFPSDAATFGARLRFMRKKRGFSQDTLAEKLGYKGGGSISKLENDTQAPSIPTLATVAEVLEADLNWLISGKFGVSQHKWLLDLSSLKVKLEDYLRSYSLLCHARRDQLAHEIDNLLTRRDAGEPIDEERLRLLTTDMMLADYRLQQTAKDQEWLTSLTESKDDK